MVRFTEKPTIDYRVSMGVYGLSKTTLKRYTVGQPLGFDDLVLDLLDREEPPEEFGFDGFWLDIGRPDDYDRANAEFAEPASRAAQGGVMRALLVGASGYLGAHVHRAAVAAGIEVVTAGRRRRARRARSRRRAGRGRRGDRAASRPTSSSTAPGRPSGDLATLTAANVDGPAALVTALLRIGRAVRPAVRLVHLGSAAEYGRGPGGRPVPGGRAGPAAEPVRGDQAGRHAARPAGPGGRVCPRSCCGCSTRSGRARRATPCPGGRRPSWSGRSGRTTWCAWAAWTRCATSWTSDDVAAAVLAAATGPVPADGVVNVGSGTAVPARELVRTLVGVSGARVRIEEGDGGSARSADVPWQQADITAATAAWDWRPRTPLAVSLEGLWRQAAERVL